MNSDFKATCTHAEDMGDYLLVGLADQRHDTVDYLTFQRAHEFDEQDVRLGLNNVYVERNDQGYSGYGGIRSITIFSDHLHIEFDDHGADFMDGITTTDIVFDFPRESLEALRAGLLQCFSGYDFFHDRTQTG